MKERRGYEKGEEETLSGERSEARPFSLVDKAIRDSRKNCQTVLGGDSEGGDDTWYQPKGRQALMDRRGRGPNGTFGDERAERRFVRPGGRVKKTDERAGTD